MHAMECAVPKDPQVAQTRHGPRGAVSGLQLREKLCCVSWIIIGVWEGRRQRLQDVESPMRDGDG